MALGILQFYTLSLQNSEEAKRRHMAKIIFKNTGEIVEVEDGSPLVEVCENHGIPFGCTDGVCGTCIAFVDEGMNNLTPPTDAEIDFLGQSGVKTERMMCQCKITCGEVTVSS